MKYLSVTAALLLSLLSVFADTPGKATNHPSKVSFQNVESLAGYTLYWHKHYGDTTVLFSSDTSFIIPGSGGAPDGAECWGIDKKTGKSTDTISFSNYYSPDYVLLLNGLRGDSIRYDMTELSNANEVVETVAAAKDSISNKQLLVDAEQFTQQHQLRNILLGSLAGAAIAGLVWFFIRRRKRKAAAQGTGS